MNPPSHRARDVRRARLDDPPRTLVVSPSFLLRSAYSLALEDDGHVVLEAATADEVLWCLVAGRTGDGEPIDLIVADASTRGALALLGEVRSSPRPPAMVLVGCDGRVDGGAPERDASGPRGLNEGELDARSAAPAGPASVSRRTHHTTDALDGVLVVPNARKLEDVLVAVDRALEARARRRDDRAGAPTRVVVAIHEPARRDAMVAALTRRGAGVIEVEDGLALLEFMGRQLNQAGWYPDAVVLDARLPRMDGLDALDEVRQYDRKVRGVVLAAGDDADASERVRALTPAVLFDRDAPVDEVAERVLRGRGSTTRTVRFAKQR